MGILSQALGLETLSAAPAGDPLPPAGVTVPTRSAKPSTTPARFMGVPAAFRAIELLSGLASQMPLTTWRHDVKVETHPLCTRPDPWRERSAWVERNVVNLATDGNAFWRRHRDTTGAVISLEVLDPARVRPYWTDRGVKKYEVTDRRTGRTEDLTTADVRHIWFLETPGLDRSLSPIGWCRAAATGILDVRDYADTWFDDSDIPSGVLSTDQRLDPTSAKEYKDKWLRPDDEHHGPKVRVLGQGLTYRPIALNPKDAQWLESQNAGVLDVCRMFGLPPVYLHAELGGSSLTYANVQDIDTQTYRLTLFPRYLRKIEDALTDDLPGLQRARFDADELLRPDAKTRADVDKTYVDAGVYDGAYVRRREGIPDDAAPAPRPAKEPAA